MISTPRNYVAIMQGIVAAGHDDLVNRIAQEFTVPVHVLLGPNKSLSVRRARWALYIELRRRHLSYPQIGKLMDRHHTTVLHACRSAADLPEELRYKGKYAVMPLVKVRVVESA